MEMSDWAGLYSEGWKGAIVDDAFSHPAKFSRALIRHIYDHAILEGWLRPGDHVVDPFGGVALGALDAMRLGLHWTGCELEQKFVDLGQRNIDLWASQFAGVLPTWGTARILQGDSRQLCEVVRDADGVVGSPPYERGCAHTGGDDKHPEHIQGGQYHGLGYSAAIASPPYNPPMSQDHNGSRGGKRGHTPSEKGAFCRYGNTEGQLEGMKMGDIEAVITSPPFGAGETRDRTAVSPGNVADCITRSYTQDKQGMTEGNLAHMDATISSPPYSSIRQDGGRIAKEGVGGFTAYTDEAPDTWHTQRDQKNIGNLREPQGDFEAVVSSPPFEGVEPVQDKSFRLNDGRTAPPQGQEGYGNTDGQLGQAKSTTFWSAARDIVDQVYQCLKPGGVSIWVTKAFVRNKSIVDFPGQWQALCESVGFEMLHYHRAMLIEDRGAQYDLFGELHEKQVKRCSFFRRIYEAKYPENRIDWEVVLCLRKPL